MTEREKFRSGVVGRTITDVEFGSHSERDWPNNEHDVVVMKIVLDNGVTIYLDGSGLIDDKAVFAELGPNDD